MKNINIKKTKKPKITTQGRYGLISEKNIKNRKEKNTMKIFRSIINVNLYMTEEEAAKDEAIVHRFHTGNFPQITKEAYEEKL